MKKPIIALTLDWNQPGNYSIYPWYAMRENHCNTIVEAGGVPILLPHHLEQIDLYLDIIDGLIITGGANDIDPKVYGQEVIHPKTIIKENRSNFEIAITQKALTRDIPILGICGGQQVLNVVLVGDLIQHIPDEWEEPLPHEQPNPRNEAGHTVEVYENTLLRKIVGKHEIPVNSAHHQAVKNVGDGVVINAIAPDGIIEGIEDPRYRFCLGVQWHPEYIISDGDRHILKALVAAAAEYHDASQ